MPILPFSGKHHSPFSGNVSMAKKKIPPKSSPHAPPIRLPNIKTRGREYLTEAEVDQLRRAAGGLGRHGARDATMILVAYRHGLRVSELISWQWDQVDLKAATVFVRRCKGSKSGMHTLERRRDHRASQAGTDHPGSDRPRLPERARRTTLRIGILQDRLPGRRGSGAFIPGSSPYAPPCLRVRVDQGRTSHPDDPGMAGPSEHPAHGAVYRARPGPVPQGGPLEPARCLEANRRGGRLMHLCGPSSNSCLISRFWDLGCTVNPGVLG